VHREPAVSEKKNVVSTIGSATRERITWLAKMERYNVRNRAVAGENRVAVQRVVHDVADEKTEENAKASSMLVRCAFRLRCLMNTIHAERNRAQTFRSAVEGRQTSSAGEISEA